MGTSKAYGGLTGKPKWGALSRTISRAVTEDLPTQKSLGKVMVRTVDLLRTFINKDFSRAGVGSVIGMTTAQQLGNLLVNFQQFGFADALNGISQGVYVDDVHSAIGIILENCVDKVSTLDGVAARAAITDLIQEITDAETIEEFGNAIDEAVNSFGVEELLVKYFGFYLFEHLSTNFYEKLIKEKGFNETESFYAELKDYIMEKTKTISMNRDLRSIDWSSSQGLNLVQEIFLNTLKEFEFYES